MTGTSNNNVSALDFYVKKDKDGPYLQLSDGFHSAEAHIQADGTLKITASGNPGNPGEQDMKKILNILALNNDSARFMPDTYDDILPVAQKFIDAFNQTQNLKLASSVINGIGVTKETSSHEKLRATELRKEATRTDNRTPNALISKMEDLTGLAVSFVDIGALGTRGKIFISLPQSVIDAGRQKDYLDAVVEARNAAGLTPDKLGVGGPRDGNYFSFDVKELEQPGVLQKLETYFRQNNTFQKLEEKYGKDEPRSQLDDTKHLASAKADVGGAPAAHTAYDQAEGEPRHHPQAGHRTGGQDYAQGYKHGKHLNHKALSLAHAGHTHKNLLARHESQAPAKTIAATASPPAPAKLAQGGTLPRKPMGSPQTLTC